MIPFDKAYKEVIDNTQRLGYERVNIHASLNRVLAEDILSDMDMPPFDKSAMDGYACRMEDLSEVLTCVEVIPAGTNPRKEISRGLCAKIMTGSMIPKGADCVIMIEDVEEVEGQRIRYKKEKTKTNICIKGEDIIAGQMVIPAGIRVKPEHIAVMASVGCTNPLVYKQPKICVITTGEELVEPHQKPDISQIRNSNGSQLIAQLLRIGIQPTYYGIVGDSEESSLGAMKKAASEQDIILLTGGVSMGDFDLVPLMMEKAGFDIRFRKIAVQPGKPTTFGVKDTKICFGLPGNPVSSFIQFELLVKPAIMHMMGNVYKPLSLNMPMGIDFSRKRSERRSWIPVRIKDARVYPIDYHGSAHLNALTAADAIMMMDIGQKEILQGESAYVRLI